MTVHSAISAPCARKRSKGWFGFRLTLSSRARPPRDPSLPCKREMVPLHEFMQLVLQPILYVFLMHPGDRLGVAAGRGISLNESVHSLCSASLSHTQRFSLNQLSPLECLLLIYTIYRSSNPPQLRCQQQHRTLTGQRWLWSSG